MNQDLKKLIAETIKKTFASAPEKLIERGLREIQYDICPHCKTEIYERHEYTEDGGTTWRHAECKGLISRPETPIEKIDDWLRPYVAEARNQRGEARRALGYEPLADDQPGGIMTAVNVSEIGHRTGEPLDPYEKADDETGVPPESPDNDPASQRYDSKKPTVILHPYPKAVPQHGVNETEMQKSQNEETKPIPPRGYERFFGGKCLVQNARKEPINVTLTEFVSKHGEIQQSAFLINIS